MDNSRLENLFQRYVDGTATPEESSELIDHLVARKDPRAKALMEELWKREPEKMPVEKAEFILDSILSREAKVVPIKTPTFTWAKVAAVAALLLLSGFAAFRILGTDSSENNIAQSPEANEPVRHLLLPDGSSVILNKESKVTYNDSPDIREVRLTGEAFFDIRHDAGRPFVVHTGQIRTTVLGTAFNIKAYPAQDNITVTVTRGKVRVSENTKVLGILTPDEQIVYQKNNGNATTAAVASATTIAWINSDIFFDEVSMADAINELEHRFGVTIKFQAENLKTCRFTATFTKDQDVYQILQVICAFNGMSYAVNEKNVIEISGAGCSQ